MSERAKVEIWKDPATVQIWVTSHSCGYNVLRAEHLEIMLALLAAFQGEGLRILDLGCGDGVVDEMLLQRLAGSTVVGVDSSAPMLAEAAKRLAPYSKRFQLVEGELEAVGTLDLPEPFDAAIGVQSIHHLDGPGKLALFKAVADVLRPGGFFLISDRVMIRDAAMFPLQLALWNRLQEQHGNQPATNYGYAAHLESLAQGGDNPDTVEDQLAWLREAGFGAVDCFTRHVERAVFGGLKVPATPHGTPLVDDHSLYDEDAPGF